MAFTETNRVGFVAITGCGWVMPSGAGNSGLQVGSADSPDASENGPRLRVIGDDLFEALANPAGELAADRHGRIASAALSLAAQQAGLVLPYADPTRVGLVLSIAQAGQGGMIRFAEEVRAQSPRFVSPIHFPETVGNYLAGALARAYGLRGPNLTVSGGPGAGIEGFGEAVQMIQHGAADVVFVGGCEAWTPSLVEQSPPDQVAVSEGACFVVLERDDVFQSRGVNAQAHGQCRQHQPEVVDQAEYRGCATGVRTDAICLEPQWGYCPSAGPLLAVAAVIDAAAGQSTAVSAVVLPEPNAQGKSILSLRIPPRQTA